MIPHACLVPALAQASAESSSGPGAFNLIDLIGLGLVLFFLTLGALHGLWWQAVRLLGIVAAVALARAVAPQFSPPLAQGIPGLGRHAANGVTWLFVLLIGLLAVWIVVRVGRAKIASSQLRVFDRLGGAIAGVFSGLVVHIALVLVAFQIASPSWKTNRLEGTQSEALLSTVGRKFPVLIDARAAETLPDEPDDSGSIVR